MQISLLCSSINLLHSICEITPAVLIPLTNGPTIWLLPLVLCCAARVVLASHPISGLVALIAAVLGAVFVLLSYGLTTFIVLMLAIIYIGAISMLFLFIIMLLTVAPIEHSFIHRPLLYALLSIVEIMVGGAITTVDTPDTMLATH